MVNEVEWIKLYLKILFVIKRMLWELLVEVWFLEYNFDRRESVSRKI